MQVPRQLAQPVTPHLPVRPDRAAPSPARRVSQLRQGKVIDPGIAERLERGPGWARRRAAIWKMAQVDVICLVRELAGVPAGQTVPVRGFSWRPGQRHRPGLQYMVSTSWIYPAGTA